MVKLNTEIGELKFPDTLVATVLERLDGLDEISVRVIKLCACFGFEFRLAELRLVALGFLDGNTNETLDIALQVLQDRQMIVHVQETRADVHLKFTHQILCESAYGLMASSFREQVHTKIASVLDTGTRKTKTEILAYHFIRAGNKERGCTLLYAASKSAMRVRALKEAYNSIALAIASAPSDDAKFVYTSFAAWIKR